MPGKLVVGLIGGIGSGKSRVASLLAEQGARVIAADAFGHEALRQPDIKRRAVERWGRELLDERGEIDRRRLGGIVFASPQQRRALETLVFPWIERRIAEEIEAAQRDPQVRLIVLDAAIMLETGWNRVCDRLVFVDAPAELRRQRLAEQRGWGPKEVQAREDAQMALADKRRKADHVVDNSGSPEQLCVQIEDLLREWGLR
jgi:dephospho-CoA kinase